MRKIPAREAPALAWDWMIRVTLSLDHSGQRGPAESHPLQEPDWSMKHAIFPRIVSETGNSSNDSEKAMQAEKTAVRTRTMDMDKIMNPTMAKDFLCLSRVFKILNDRKSNASTAARLNIPDLQAGVSL
jgi:hypothetical protein